MHSTLNHTVSRKPQTPELQRKPQTNIPKATQDPTHTLNQEAVPVFFARLLLGFVPGCAGNEAPWTALCRVYLGAQDDSGNAVGV